MAAWVGLRGTERVQVSLPRQCRRDVADYAEAKIGALRKYAAEPILHARVRLTVHADPSIPRPVIAEGNLDLNGRLVRAQVAGGTARAAVDALHDTLRSRLTRMARDWPARRGRMPSGRPHEWRHRSIPTRRPDYYPRPIGEREVVRHKTHALSTCTADDAAAEMDLMDFDFHLFTEAGSGEDSVLYRAAGELRLAQAKPQPIRVTLGATPFEVDPAPAGRLGLTDAVRSLDLSGQPFLFYVDAATGRGCLLYHRYDGHYGLISPAD